MEAERSKMSFIEAFIIVCVLLHSVLDIYSFRGNITYGIIADILIFGLALTTRKGVNRIPRPLWYYIGYRVLMSFLSFGSHSSMIPAGFLLQVATLYATFRVVHLSNFLRIFRFLGYITSIFLILQFIALTFFDIRISGVLEFLPIAIGDGAYLDDLALRIRPASIFSEPAHFSQFILPLLCVEIFDENRKRSLSLIILIIIALLFSMSGTALVGLIMIAILYMVKLVVQHASINKVLWVILLIVLLPFGYQYYSHSELGESVLDRTEFVREASQASAVSSEYVRIFRGYDVYGAMSFGEKIFGCGSKEVIIKNIAASKYLYLFDSESFFFNGVATVLLYTGLIGLFLYVFSLFSMWKGNSYCGKSLIILLVSLMLIASIVINATGVVFLFLASTYRGENIERIYSLKSKDLKG